MENQDRELLEQAAKAIGMQVVQEGDDWPDGDVWFHMRERGVSSLVNIRTGNSEEWNPLANDADTKELVSRLGLQVSVSSDVAGAAGNVRVATSDSRVVVHESYLPGGRQSALRLAITRAAAEAYSLA